MKCVNIYRLRRPKIEYLSAGIMDTPPAPAPDDPRPPGTVLLQDFMQPLGISAYRVAKDLSLAPITVSEILRGLRSISPTVACRLGTYFGVPPAYWLLVQASYEAHAAAKAGKANGAQICEALQLNSELQEGLRSKAMQTAFLGSNGNQSPPSAAQKLSSRAKPKDSKQRV